MKLLVRPAIPEDVDSLLPLLNKIIDLGGTTAYQVPLSPEEFLKHFISGNSCLNCFVAVTDQQLPVGFQALSKHPRLADEWADIATFADGKTRGAGSALFNATAAYAKQAGFAHINATIRADNAAGLGYYNKMGFVDYSVAKSVPLQDGKPVDRIHKQFDL